MSVVKSHRCVAAAAWLVLNLASLAAGQDSVGKRVPSRVLRPEMAGILLSDGREALERPSETLDRLQLMDGDIVADLGAGNGWYSLRLAERIAPHGVVFAVDVQEGMLDLLRGRMEEAGARNVYPVLGTATDPNLPPGKIDWVLLVDAYHEFSDPEAMLERIREALAPDGRVALSEYRAEQDLDAIPLPIPRDHRMTVDQILSEWLPAGFRVVERIEVLPAQHLFIFERGSSGATPANRSEITPITLDGTSNVTTLDDSIYFAGQPSAADLRMFANLGVKTVLNLRTTPELEGLGFDERAEVEAAGMTYVHVPMGTELPVQTDLDRILETLDGAQDGPVLLHCASSNRVGSVWAVYRGLRGGVEVDAAIEAGKAAGLRSPALEKAAREYLTNRQQ